MSSTNRLDLTIGQGTTFARMLGLTDPAGDPIDITGDTFAGQIRVSYASVLASASFVFTVDSAVGGTVEMLLRDDVTAGFKAPAVYVYDVERTSAAGAVTRLMWGKIKVTPEVTR